MTSSPLKYHGGKHYLAPKLIPHLPPHVHRVHPFAGGLSELFAWPFEGVSEVVNDLDGELSNFWHVLAICGDEFARQVSLIPFSEERFNLAKTSTLTNPIDRAINFFVRCRQSRQGLMKDFATLSRNRTRRGMNEQVSSWLTAIEGLPEIHTRLKRVVVLNRPALDVIRQQDGPYTFFYCDPPYLHETRETTADYKHEMSAADHTKLLNVLAGIKGKFMLSGYPSGLYESAANSAGWRVVDFDLPNNASSKAKKQRKVERVWMNYLPA